MFRYTTTLGVLVSALPALAQESVPQATAEAERLRGRLAAITLPEGFRIDLYALVPEARHMAVAADGTVFVGTRGDRVWAVRDADGDGVAEVVTAFAPEAGFVVPNGPCLDSAGTLYVAERDRVRAFPDAVAAVGSPVVEARDVVAEGDLVPPGEVSRGHGARVCRIGPDGLIYVSLGQPHNVSPPDKLALYDRTGVGGIVRMATDGSGREVHSRGIRNSVGHDFHPVTGELWFTDNQVDGMGDDVPPGEINRQTAPGQHFGFPWYGGGQVRTDDYADDTPPGGVVFPVSETVAHAADLGMTFYRGTMFPETYRNAIFSAQHGSWNRTEPVGARVMVTETGDGTAPRVETRPFAEGWKDQRGAYWGRPVDVAELPDGSLLVSDDRAGALWRITYAPG